MAPFEQHPPHIRKKIAYMITGGVALLLIVLLVIIYSHKKAKGTAEPTSRLQMFYNTILEKGQQYVGAE